SSQFPISNLQAQKPTWAPFARAPDFEVSCLRFGPSLELGAWCLVFPSEAAQKLSFAAPSACVLSTPTNISVGARPSGRFTVCNFLVLVDSSESHGLSRAEAA